MKINPKDGRSRACLTYRDPYTNFVWITPVPDLTAKHVIEVLEVKLFSVFGSPETIVSDNHASFKNEQMSSFLRRWGSATEFRVFI